MLATPGICPACDRIAKGTVSGYLRLEGAFLASHRPDIEHLLKNEADRAEIDNPTGRIIEWDRSTRGVLLITTTTEHLVKRLGHAVKRTFGGKIDYGFSHGNKLARATWRRD